MKFILEDSKDQILEYFTVERIKGSLIKRYKRFTESKWTQYFIITSIIQAIFAIVFISRMLDRNNKAGDEFKSVAPKKNPKDCVAIYTDRIGNIVGENVVFIIFNIFQLWFCQNAIYNQNTIQIITIAVINYLCALFAIVQIVEIVMWTTNAHTCVPNFNYPAKIAAYEVPLIIILVICATLQVFFTWKLYQQFGWNIYKKIGADLRMQRLYRSMLIFVMLLKIDLFFMNFLAIEGCIVTRPSQHNGKYFSEGFYYFHIGITITIVLLQLLVWRSLRRESSLGMKIFIGAWVVCIFDLVILLVSSIKPREESWYFFTYFIVTGIIMGLVTLIFSIFLLRNFGKGLKPHLSRRNSDGSLTQSNTSPPQRVGTGTPIRWAIDD